MNNILKLLYICQITILIEELSLILKNVIQYETQTTLKKHLMLSQHFSYQNIPLHWIAENELPEPLVTDNGTDFINYEFIILCHLYNIKHKPRISHGPRTSGLVEGMNRSLQKKLRCIINGTDTKYTE